MKRVLITGANSYIGTSVEKWLMKEPQKYKIDTIDMIDGSWKEKSFNGFDVVFHVAGIAHVSSDPKMESKYYKVNRDLTIETAKKAKDEGIKQFVFMSSIIVYSDNKISNGVITKDVIPQPENFYGKSKLEAEKGIAPLEDNSFKIAILRPPMIYGKGCKGNYQKLSKIAKKVPIFPDIDNSRSMLHIDNLCEMIKKIIDNNESSIFYPQNREYVRTSDLVKTIASAHGKKIFLVKCFNPIIKIFRVKIDLFKKLFGCLVYEKKLSEYREDYQIRDFEESIFLTEK